MKFLDSLDSLTWAKTVNAKWLVHSNLNRSAKDWMLHLATLDDGRLVTSCGTARAMCHTRDHFADPKPWFYAGLFHLATAEEARQFLTNHWMTRATLPSLAIDEKTNQWLDSGTPETRALVDRLRTVLAVIGGG
jgi:hypothetical protein